MLWLVAYDIASPKRLHRIAKTCLDYGVRVEKSVFECDLEEEVFATFWQELNERIDPAEDAIVAYRICATCVREALSAGTLVRPETVLAYII
ncbi:MAG: CRISPR-associated endonuclease Cas2 [Kiritimatiellia bacterium]